MLRIAICDNDQEYREYILEKLKLYIKDRGKKAHILIYTDGKSLIDSKESLDILFMDIELKYENGMEVAKEYQKRKGDIILIFLTNHEEFSRKGYHLQAFRFLSKKDPLEDIYEAISSAIVCLEKKERIMVETEKGVVFLSYHEIYYLEAQGRFVKVHTLQETIISRKKISEYVNCLEDKGFYLVHRAFLINLRHIYGIIKKDIYLRNGDIVPLSEKRKKDFESMLVQSRLIQG